MNECGPSVTLVVSQIIAVVVWLASTLGLAVFLLFCKGHFEYRPWR